MVDIMRNFIKSEHTEDWNLQVLHKMLHYLAAVGHYRHPCLSAMTHTVTGSALRRPKSFSEWPGWIITESNMVDGNSVRADLNNAVQEYTSVQNGTSDQHNGLPTLTNLLHSLPKRPI